MKYNETESSAHSIEFREILVVDAITEKRFSPIIVTAFMLIVSLSY